MARADGVVKGGSSVRIGPGGHGTPFAKKLIQSIKDFSGGLNNKFSPLIIADNELSDIQNFTYDEKGTLTQRLGYVQRYASTFATGGVRGLYNYRKEDGTSRLIMAADDKWFYDKPQFSQLYNTEALFETTGTLRDAVDTVTTPGTVTMRAGGSGMGGFSMGGRQGAPGGALTLHQSIWRTQNLDISAVQDKTTGTLVTALSVPTGASATVETRYSTDQVTWTAWTALGPGNTIQSVGTNTWLQGQVRFNSTTRLRASMTSFNVKFDITATVTQIAAGLSTSARWRFETMNDTLFGVDGVDTMKQWDGTTFQATAGSPPVTQYIKLHKNILFLAGQSATNRSRLYFSALSDPTTWPVLNFIDVGKGDGDTITGLAILNNNLIITKDHSVWALQGDSAANFVLRRMTDEAGAVTGSSFGGVVKQILPMLARDGVYFFDGVRAVLASEKITKTLQGMNQRQLAQASAVVMGIGYTRKYFLSLPEGSATTNTTILVYDSLRNAWTVYRGMPASELVVFRQFNADTLMFGDPVKGQVYQAETGYNDNGNVITAYFVTKAFDPEGPAMLHLGRRVLVDGREPQGLTTTATVSYFKDLGSESSTTSISFVNPLNILRSLPGAVGIGAFHSLAIKVTHADLNRGLNVYEVSLEYVLKGLRATG